jgi:hypothetical protein
MHLSEDKLGQCPQKARHYYVVRGRAGKIYVHMWACDHHKEDVWLCMKREAVAMGLMCKKEI